MTKTSYLASPSATKAVLDRFGLSAKHALGQNFLVNDGILTKILALAEVSAQDVVLEVGPGIGTLTVALLPVAGQVISVELDPALPPVLHDTCSSWADTFRLIQKDALLLEQGDFAPFIPNKLVSNLPYGVAATVVLTFFERFSSLESITVMVQKEVALRMMAGPGSKDYGAYTVKLGLFAEPAGSFAVAPENFLPAPRVQSAVLRLNRRVITDCCGIPLSPEIMALTALAADAAFFTRRKTIANSFKAFFGGRGAEGKFIARDTLTLLERAGIASTRRGETLTREEFIALGKALGELLSEIPDEKAL